MLQNNRFFALTTGFSLILMAVAAGVAYGYGFQQLYVPGDAGATWSQLISRPELYNSLVGGFGVTLILDFVVAWSLYRYFQSRYPTLSVYMAALRLLYALFLAVAVWYLIQLGGIRSGAPDPDGAMGAIAAFNKAWSLGLIVFGAHLLLLGVLVVRAPESPSALGYLAAFAGLCYAGIHSAAALWPGFKQYQASVEAALGLPMALGELLLAFWFIFKYYKCE